MDPLAAIPPSEALDELRRRRLLVPASEIEGQAARVASGFEELDRLAGGGLPRGGIVELIVPPTGGGTVLVTLLASAAAREEWCALVDPADAFDVVSAEAAGVVLRRLLWVRARDRKEALRAAELILDAGGFGMLLVDLGVEPVGSVPAAAWMRLRRLATACGATVVVLAPDGAVGTFASLSIRARRARTRFHGRAGGRWLEGIDLSFALRRRKA